MTYSHRSPKGNRNMRRILNQAANAAVKARGTIVYHPLPKRAAFKWASVVVDDWQEWRVRCGFIGRRLPRGKQGRKQANKQQGPGN